MNDLTNITDDRLTNVQTNRQTEGYHRQVKPCICEQTQCWSVHTKLHVKSKKSQVIYQISKKRLLKKKIALQQQN